MKRKYPKKKQPQRKKNKDKRKRHAKILGGLRALKDLNLKSKEYKSRRTSQPQTIRLSDEDRITYEYEYEEGKTREIMKLFVSYEVLINGKWQTIFRYDNHEDERLHKHYWIKGKDIISFAGVIQKGDPRKWLTWAIKDFQKNFYGYKRLYFKRNKD